MEFNRKTKEDKPVLAICYDFDKTLSPDDMQAQGYIQSVGYDVQQFWKESNEMAVSKRIGTKVRLTGKPGQPADKIEILDDFRKQSG